MGLFVYTRHTADCPNLADRFWRRCRCPKWIRGLLRGNPVRVSAKTRSWERAESKLREMDGAGGPDETKLASKITIKEAVEAFLKDGHRMVYFRDSIGTSTGRSGDENYFSSNRIVFRVGKFGL